LQEQIFEGKKGKTQEDIEARKGENIRVETLLSAVILSDETKERY
jgi:hypothetical protein